LCTASDKQDGGDSGSGEQNQQPALTYTGGPKGKDEEVSHINDGSTPVSVFLLYFAETITPLVVQTNRYYHDYTDRLDNGPSPEPVITEAEMFVFLSLATKMGHGIMDKMRDCWGTVYQLYTLSTAL
jgi:hypothetical protein